MLTLHAKDRLSIPSSKTMNTDATAQDTLGEHLLCPLLSKSMAVLRVFPLTSSRNGIFKPASEFDCGAGGRNYHVRSDFGQVMNLSGFRRPSRPKSSACASAASSRAFRIPRPFFRPFLRASEEMDNTLSALPKMSVHSFTSERRNTQLSVPDRWNSQRVSFLRS